MIPLDSSKWEQLRHAYGSASDIPDLLRDVIRTPYENGGAWFDLWSALCHQGDIYPASVAAVPHIIAGGLEAKDGILATGFISLPVSIEESRMKRPEQIRPDDIESDYRKAILQLRDLCDLVTSRSTTPSLRQAIQFAGQVLRVRHGAPLPSQKEGDDLGELFLAGDKRAEHLLSPD